MKRIFTSNLAIGLYVIAIPIVIGIILYYMGYFDSSAYLFNS